MKKGFILIIYVFSFCSPLFAEYGTTSLNFLKLSQGARETAMGSSYCAFSEGATSLYWNPAGLATGLFNEARMVYNSWFEGIYYGYAAYRHRFDYYSLGLAITYLDSGAIERRTAGRELSGSSYSMSDVAVDAGIGFKLRRELSLGFSAKYVRETIDTEKLNTVLIGMGTIYKQRYEDHFVSAGLAIMNIGAKVGYSDKFDPPTLVRFGLGDDILSGRLRASAELDYHVFESEYGGGVGLEFAAAPYLDLRCGYDFSHDYLRLPQGLTGGFGISYIEEIEYLFDYSISSFGDLGYVNRISFGMRF